MEDMGAIFDLKDKKYLKGGKFLPKRRKKGDFSLILTAKETKNCKQYRSQICPNVTLFFSSFPTQNVIQASMLLLLFSLALERPTLFDTKMENR